MIDGWRAENYADLIALLRQRKVRLGLTNLEVDARGGLPSGYFSKLQCGLKRASVTSLGKVLAALEVELAVVPRSILASKDNSETTEIAAQNAYELKKYIGIFAGFGGRKRALMVAPERRREIARLASLARWRREAATRLLTCGPRGGKRRKPLAGDSERGI